MGGHGPFRGLDAPLALRSLYPEWRPDGKDPATLNVLVRERNVQTRCIQDVILLLARGRVAHIDVSESILPTEPLAELGHGTEIERRAIVTRTAEIGIKVGTLSERCTGTQFVHELFANRRRGEISAERVVVLTCVVHAPEQVQCRPIAFDCVEPETTPENRSQVQGLELVGLEIGADEREQSRSDVVVVTKSALDCVRGCSGNRAGSIIGGVNRVRVDAEFVMKRFAGGSEGQSQVLGLAVAAGQGERDG